jgi:TRAP-type C4-dicarboxylate transport system permease small subunit
MTAHKTGFWRSLDDNLERYLMLVCYIFCCAVIIQEVARRYIINSSGAWAQETAQYAFIYLGWIGAAYAVKERAHIRFDILQNKLPARLHGPLFILGEIATIVFAVIAFRYSWHTIEQLWRYEGATPVLRVSKIWAEAAVPFGFALILVRSLQRIWVDVSDMRAGREVFKGKALFEE